MPSVQEYGHSALYCTEYGSFCRSISYILENKSSPINPNSLPPNANPSAGMFLKTPWTVCPTPPNSAIQRSYYWRFVLAVKFPPTAAAHRPLRRPISIPVALCLRLPGLGITAKGFPPKSVLLLFPFVEVNLHTSPSSSLPSSPRLLLFLLSLFSFYLIFSPHPYPPLPLPLLLDFCRSHLIDDLVNCLRSVALVNGPRCQRSPHPPAFDRLSERTREKAGERKIKRRRRFLRAIRSVSFRSQSNSCVSRSVLVSTSLRFWSLACGPVDFDFFHNQSIISFPSSSLPPDVACPVNTFVVCVGLELLAAVENTSRTP